MNVFEFDALSDLIGLLGVGVYLGSYFALQAGFIRGQGYLYPALNMAAAACVLFDLQKNFNLSSAMIQISWIIISLVGIGRMIWLRHGARFSAEETAFLNSKLPNLERSLARKLLNTAVWVELAPGDVLVRQGTAVDELVYLASGSVSVQTDGVTVVEYGPDAFVGEVTCLTGAAATATCILSSAARCLSFPAATVRELAMSEVDIRRALEAAFSIDIREKMMSSNAALRSHIVLGEADTVEHA